MTSAQHLAHRNALGLAALLHDAVALLDHHLHAREAAAEDAGAAASAQLRSPAPSEEALAGDARGDEVDDLAEAASAGAEHTRADDARLLAEALGLDQLQALLANTPELARVEDLKAGQQLCRRGVAFHNIPCLRTFLP